MFFQLKASRPKRPLWISFITLSTLQLRAIDRTHSRAGEPDQSQTPLSSTLFHTLPLSPSLPRGSNFFSNSVEATLCCFSNVLCNQFCGYFWVLLVPWVLECGNAHGKRCSIIWIKAALLPPKTDPSPSILPFQTFVTFRAAAQVFNATRVPPILINSPRSHLRQLQMVTHFQCVARVFIFSGCFMISGVLQVLKIL